MIITLLASCEVDTTVGIGVVHTTANPEDPCEVPGNICTWLGVPNDPGFSGEGTDRSDDPITGTRLYSPVDITFAPDGTAYYPEFINNRIRRVSLTGIVTTLSGTGFLGDGPNNDWSITTCWDGCPALESAWNHPSSVTIDPFDPAVLWVAAWDNNRIKRLDQHSSTMTWWAGNGMSQFLDGLRQEAIFDHPTSIAVDLDGMMYVSDSENYVIRRISPDGRVDTIAGHPRQHGYDGDGGPALDAHLNAEEGRRADPESRITLKGSLLYVVDRHHERRDPHDRLGHLRLHV